MRSANRRQTNNQLSPNPERLQRQATTPPELRPSSGDDDPGEDGQAAASDANDVSDAQ
jgi:hypothetical protein